MGLKYVLFQTSGYRHVPLVRNGEPLSSATICIQVEMKDLNDWWMIKKRLFIFFIQNFLFLQIGFCVIFLFSDERTKGGLLANFAIQDFCSIPGHWTLFSAMFSMRDSIRWQISFWECVLIGTVILFPDMEISWYWLNWKAFYFLSFVAMLQRSLCVPRMTLLPAA